MAPEITIPTFDREATEGAERAGPLEIFLLAARGVRLAWRAAPREIALCASLQLLSGLGVVVQLVLGRNVLAAVIDSSRANELADVAPDLVVLGVVTAVVAGAVALLSERQRMLAALVERHVHDRILDVVALVPLADFEDPTFHDRMRRATVNASERSWQVAMAIVSLFSSLAMLLPVGLVLARIEPWILPAVLAAYLPLHLATTRNGRASYQFTYKMTTPDRERAYLGGVLAGPGAAKELRLFGSGPWLRQRYDELFDRRILEMRRLTHRRTGRALLANAWSTAITIGGIALLVHWALTGRLSPSQATIAAVAVQQVGGRMRTLGASAGSLHECGLFLDDVTRFLDHPPEVPDLGARPAAPERFDLLQAEDLTFAYPGTDTTVLHGVSIELSGDEIVAIVGSNGSGKTTLAKVLCGLYQPTSGRILWDGVDAAELDPVSLRRRMAAAFQDFARYELTGRANIGLGDVARMEDLDAIRLAAEASGAHGALDRLPQGYETRLSRAYDDGAELSIGQWQRVALARAFLRDAPFLVLDEPTASLDPHAERELFDAMRQLQRGRAVLLISHRFSSVRAADRIYVLDRGEVIESGSHASLMEQGGRYAEMFTLQAEAYTSGDGAPGGVV